jgi:hypothetical protein
MRLGVAGRLKLYFYQTSPKQRQFVPLYLECADVISEVKSAHGAGFYWGRRWGISSPQDGMREPLELLFHKLQPIWVLPFYFLPS